MSDQMEMFDKSRADQIFERFIKFFKANPHVWKLFQRFTFQLIDAGFKHHGAGAVFERMRWHVSIETKNEDGLKLSNDFRAYYARLFHVAFPDHEGFFRNRKRRSEDDPTSDFNGAPTAFQPPSRQEAGIYAQLKKLLDE